jgi:methionyl-tRNA formyltransferase
MQMDAGVDTGPILAEERVPIAADEIAPRLEGRLANVGARLLVRTLDDLVEGRLQPVPQPAVGATHAPRLRSEDGKLDPTTMTAEDIDRKVRALVGRVGAWMTLKGVEVKVFRGHRGGAAVEGLPVQTVSGIYVVDEVQPPGGRVMSAAAWARGRR